MKEVSVMNALNKRLHAEAVENTVAVLVSGLMVATVLASITALF